MAARDRYEVVVKCLKCNTQGVLHISENDYPFMRKLDTEIDSVEGNISARIEGDNDIKVECRTCGCSIEVDK